ncbi:peptidase domain-containing ABC transporter [Bacteroides ovatus]|uniref:peptidase domain-containing ABC transporter n=1 Tax=Bacteroides ovatus TaxID=28116 RepID=UPI0022E084DF|nr:ABC transporter transmembrane domain-containing protein [Bacteroides ovatus]
MKLDIDQAKKVFTPQKSINLCGIACLISVCKYFNIEVTEGEILENSGAVHTGTTLLGIKESAEKLNLIADGYTCNVDELKICDTISILHTVNKDGFTHFVICFGYNDITNQFLIGDPAIGLLHCDEYYLESIWKSKLLLLLNSEKMKPQNNRRKKGNNYRYIFEIINRDTSLLLVTLILSIFASVLSLAPAIFIQKLADDIIPQKNMKLVFYGIVLYALILVVIAVISYINERIIIKQNLLFNVRILRNLLFRIFHLPITFHKSLKTGEIMSRLSDTERIQNSIILLINSVFMQIVLLFVSISILFYYELNIGIIALLSIPSLIWLSYYYSSKIEKEQKQTMAKYARFEAYSIDILSGYFAIKSYVKEKLFHKRLLDLYKSTQLKKTDLKILNSQYNLYTNLIVCAFSITIVLLSSYFVIIDKIGIGVLFAIITILAQILQASIKVVSYMVSVQEAKVAYNRSLLIIQHPLENDNPKQIDVPITNNNIFALENITFKYPGRDVLLEKINLTAKTGEFLSIFGRIGTGKTTITQLIQRFYTPSEGIITFNNADISKFDLHKWRRQIKVVSQQTKLFIGTIADNISMFSDSLENVELFCKTMKLEWFFKNEDMNLFNMIDEDGSNLSGGQKQLVGIARALYQSSPILVLDEPTASMDKECEFEVMQLLMRLKKDIIIIMITHKPEIAKLSDQIYILDNKTVAICGDHNHLTAPPQ